GERPGQQGDRRGGDQRRRVGGKGEVGDPGGVVDRGQRRPRPGQAAGVAGGGELADLGQELRNRTAGGGDRGVVEQAGHHGLRASGQEAASLRVKIRRFCRNLIAALCRNTRNSAIMFVMDGIDRKILAELQAQGRLTVTDLAQRAGLSVAPCPRRLRELERTGLIRGSRAIIAPATIGLGFEVLVQVTMDREDASTITDFEQRLAAIPEVRHAERLFGDPDSPLRVATASLEAYQALRDQQLATLPGVQKLTSTIVMKRVVDDPPYPTTPAPAEGTSHRA